MVDKRSTLVTSAFGLVAALAWNEAIKETFKHYCKKGDGLTAHILYAAIVTVIAVLVTVWIGYLAGKVKEYGEDDEKKETEQKETPTETA